LSISELDAHFKKIVTFRPFDRELRFRVSQDLFSSFDVDVGTKFLLRTLPEERRASRAVLDVGCGYGPIGLAIKSVSPGSEVHMVDRDALACMYAEQNADLNGLVGVHTYGSLLYDDLRRSDFDLIVSNVPAKAGGPVIRELLIGASAHLRPGGLAAVVVVAPLARFVADVLARGPDLVVVDRQARSGHVVFQYSRVSTTPATYRSAFDRGVYDRKTFTLSFAGARSSLITSLGLPEFDSLSHGTELLFDTLAELRTDTGSEVVISGPGQGHIPVVVAGLLRPRKIALADRDLLALRTSHRNLIRNGSADDRIALWHGSIRAVDTGEKTQLIILALRDEARPAVDLMVRRAAARLSARGLLLIGGSSTAIRRTVELVRREKLLNVREHRRRRGNSVVVATSARPAVEGPESPFGAASRSGQVRPAGASRR